MIKVKLTENYGGMNISGDYEDLNELYDSITYFLHDDAKNANEELMQNHLYGFLYDVRHAYQGDREFDFVNNGLYGDKREWLEISEKDVADNNLYYSFNYQLPELFLDIILIKYFIEKIDVKENHVFNQNIAIVMSFYSKILYALYNFLTPIKFNKIIKGFSEARIYPHIFLRQWFDYITCDYLKSTKKQREKNFMKMADAMYNFYQYEDFSKLEKKMIKFAKENNCFIGDIEITDYPEEIEW